ncbi:DNA-formamidopyrimidine glycosylase family protein [Chryseolinea lacunae]|uniref:Formamidopyrimidine-DNA glycosylase catalytic domain-containing protein n=1 Tax=Chryseolinea lacunae TaxID=2801331 RepID=A0ABS1KWT1_9BACT|nr:DNA-formamidopyrimidine glycosylase family protein [Chryseolinea lacunae]MBL0743924.1 hypothetical protein [Chryseolinea lacunae]
MPELPDLQVFSHNLNTLLKEKKLEKIAVPVAKKLNVPVATLKKKLEGQAVKKVYRDGKELHIQFGKDDVLALHLMMHGNLYRYEDKNANKHTILEMEFNDGTGIALTDWQGQATPTLNPDPSEAPDALADDVDFARLKLLLQKKAAIKNLMLDQKVIRGIGNAYADEILWDAGISPFSISQKIPDTKIKALAKSIRKVLTDAEKQIRKADPDRITGERRDFLVIHNAKKKQSPTGGEILIKVTGGRKTYYTEEQEMFE